MKGSKIFGTLAIVFGCAAVLFLSDVGHLAHIGPCQRSESCRRGYSYTAHKQILGTFEIVVKITSDAVVPESEVATNIILCRTLPFQLIQLQCLQIGYTMLVGYAAIDS